MTRLSAVNAMPRVTEAVSKMSKIEPVRLRAFLECYSGQTDILGSSAWRRIFSDQQFEKSDGTNEARRKESNRATMVAQSTSSGASHHNTESAMTDYQKKSEIASALLQKGTFSNSAVDAREPCQSDFEANENYVTSERESYDDCRNDVDDCMRDDDDDASVVELNGASNELAQRLKSRRGGGGSSNTTTSLSVTTRTSSNERRDDTQVRDESPSQSYHKTDSLTPRENNLVALLVDMDSQHSATNESGAGVATTDERMQESIDSSTPANVKALISKHEYHKSNQKNERAPMISQASQEEPTDDSDSMKEVNLNEKIFDASNKLDAALSMMEQLQRDNANRKISSMMQVQSTDKNLAELEHSSIDWETGEYDHTPWVGQVGINDELFEDEPLDYAEGGGQRQNTQSTRSDYVKGRRIVVLVSAIAMFAMACVFGVGAALYNRHKRNEPCTLCYNGSVPDDLSSSMVGGQTCADFRMGVESYRASDQMCLQGQSLAWLMCDCPSLPPFPKKPSCTLCGEGVLLKGSACNHINTFMAHISDPEYCEALKTSVSKAGCVCPEND